MVYHLQVPDGCNKSCNGQKKNSDFYCRAKVWLLVSGLYSGLGYNFVPGNSHLHRAPLTTFRPRSDLHVRGYSILLWMFPSSHQSHGVGSSASVSRTNVWLEGQGQRGVDRVDPTNLGVRSMQGSWIHTAWHGVVFYKLRFNYHDVPSTPRPHPVTHKFLVLIQ